ncbi:MAG: AAA family ATPase [Candidatus Dojkabacteria bacterium]|nr:MAG: AAA family ATPase [Candidatus Dojkabacteria bacterium]
MTNLERNEQFVELFEMLENSHQHVFITGKAGTGKSTFLQLFRDDTRKQAVVLAPTGVAAVNIKGETIHSFFKFKPDVTVEKARDIARKSTTSVYKNIDLLVIDEISMVRADLLDCIDEFLKVARKSFLPFGGIQMVFIGDLFQLPPVVSRQDRETLGKLYDTPFFFSAHVMADFPIKTIELQKVYRQSQLQFVELLNRIRENSVTWDDIKLLNTRYSKDIAMSQDEFFVYLTSTNDLAAQINIEKMKSLSEQEVAFKGRLQREFERSSLPAEEVLVLKLGAQVMMVNNDPQGRWINGTIGKITRIEQDKEGEFIEVTFQDGRVEEITPHTWDMYQFTFNEQKGRLESEIMGSFTQYPLKLAWAITIHKSQGKTFDKVVVDFGRGAFAPGQVYVALSRCTSFEGITLRSPLQRRDIWTDKMIQSFFAGTYKNSYSSNQLSF